MTFGEKDILKLFADYHTHTKYSHGKDTIEENVLKALSMGLKRIAVTDHGLGHIAFGLKRKHVLDARNEVDELREKYEGQIDILFGIEANILSMEGNTDVYPEYERYFDIILLGYHRFVKFSLWKDFRYFVFKAPRTKQMKAYENMTKITTQAINKAIRNNRIDIITHPGEYLNVDYKLLAAEAAKHGTALEINSKHARMSVLDVRDAAKEGAVFVINSDAHRRSEVGECSSGIKLAEEAGLGPHNVLNAIGCSFGLVSEGRKPFIFGGDEK